MRTTAGREGEIVLFRDGAIVWPRGQESPPALRSVLLNGWLFADAGGVEVWPKSGPSLVAGAPADSIAAVERMTVAGGLDYPRLRVILVDGRVFEVKPVRAGLWGSMGLAARTVDRIAARLLLDPPSAPVRRQRTSDPAGAR